MEGTERSDYYRVKAVEYALTKMCPNVQELFYQWMNTYLSRFVLILPGKKAEDHSYISIPDLSCVFVISRTVSFVFRDERKPHVYNFSLKYVKSLIEKQGLSNEFIDVSMYLIPIYLFGPLLKSDNIKPREIREILDNHSIYYNPYIVKRIKEKLLFYIGQDL